VVLSLYVQIKICVAVCHTNRSVPDSVQSINHCFNPEASWFCSQVKSTELAIDRVDVSGKVIRLPISLRLAIDFFTCNVHKR